MDQPRVISTNLTTRLSVIADGLRARTRILASAAKISRGELATVAAHIRQRADHAGSRRTRDNLVHAFGSNAERGGYLYLDDYAAAGLEHHGQLYAYWMAMAASETFAANRGDLLRHIFSCPSRLEWCRREGARVAWEYAKAARDEETAAFHRRQKSGSKDWRKRTMTARQSHLIALIRLRGGFADPGPLKSGPAHDWIALHGSHPDFWAAPEVGPPWVLDDSNAGWGQPRPE